MTGFLSDIVAGLLSGVLAFSLSLAFRTIVLPWYRELVYDGYKVEGTWQVETTTPAIRRDITFTLHQKAGIVTGDSRHVLKDRSQEGDPIKTYALKGELRDRFLFLTTRLEDRQRIGLGTVMIEVTGDGRKMEGSIAAYSSTASRIVSVRCTAMKISDK